jgi:hypothetical protein
MVGMARSLLKSMEVPSKFWREAVSTAVYLLNRAPTKSITSKTPYEAYHNRKSFVDHFRIFGCMGHVKMLHLIFQNLQTEANQWCLLVMIRIQKATKCSIQKSKRVVVTRDVVFEEEKKWEWNKFSVTGTGAAGNTLTAHYFTIAGLSDTTNQENKEGVSDFGVGISNSSMDFSHSTSEMNTRSKVSISDSLNTPTTTIGGFEFTESLKPETSEGSSLEVPRGKRDIKSLYDEIFPIELEYLRLCLLGEEEPSNYEEAIADPAWRKTMEEEISIIQKNGT